MNTATVRGSIERELDDRLGDEIDRHNVQHGIRIAGHGSPKAARVNLQRPIHHLEAGSRARLRVAHDNARPENDARQRSQCGAHQRFRFGLCLLVGVAKTLADVELAFIHQVGAFARDIGRSDIRQAAQIG